MIHETDMKLTKKYLQAFLMGPVYLFILVSVSVQWFALPQLEKKKKSLSRRENNKQANKQQQKTNERTNKQTNKQKQTKNRERVGRNQGKVHGLTWHSENVFLLNCLELKDVCLLFAFSHVEESTSFCD